MVEPLCDEVLSPVTFTLSDATHVYDDGTTLVNPRFTFSPLQIVFEFALLIVGAGFTVMVTVCDAPTQLPVVEVGVTV